MHCFSREVTGASRWFAVLLLLLGMMAISSCAEEIDTQTTPSGSTYAVFDPTVTPPAVPTPNDLALNTETGLLQVPVADSSTAPAQAAFDEYLNTLNGYPTNATTVEVRFSGELDPSTINASTVLAIDVTDMSKPTPVANVTITYEALAATDGGGTTSRVLIVSSKPWNRSSHYVFAVLTGDKGVKDKGGKPIARSDIFTLAASDKPICAWDETTNWDATTGDCAVPANGATATGCCRKNYSTFIEMQVEKSVRADPANADKSLFDVEKLIKQQVLSQATSFEKLRRHIDTLLSGFAANGIARNSIAVTWSLSTSSLSEVVYDPTAGVIPFPNDLLYDEATSKVTIPAQADESVAAAMLRQMINATVDGFSTQGSSLVITSGGVDAASLDATSILAFNLGTKEPIAIKAAVLEKDGTIMITPAKPLAEKSLYGIALISKLQANSLNPASGIKDKQGRRLAAAPFTALMRSSTEIYKDGHSTVSSVTDDSAQLIEKVRTHYKIVFDTLETMGFKRADVIGLWSFHTQSIGAPLQKLHALPWQIFGALDSNHPTFKGQLTNDFSSLPVGVPHDALAAWVANGKFTTWLALDEAGMKTFYPEAEIATKGKQVDVDFVLTIPQGTMPTAGWPVVVYQHGITQWRGEALALANTFAKIGYATISFDTIYHGERSWCTDNTHCLTSGTCNIATGKCSTSFARHPTYGYPTCSGANFIHFENPFAQRDIIRQYVIDAAALTRAISLGAVANITPSLSLNAANLNFVGNSLGSLVGSLALAADPLFKRGAFAVPGAPLVEMLFNSPQFAAAKTALQTSQNIEDGTYAWQKLLHVFQWVLDQADPGSAAAFVTQSPLKNLVTNTDGTKKDVYVAIAGKDDTLLPQYGSYFANAFGADVTKSTYVDGKHTMMVVPDPLALTAALHTQIATFLMSGQICTPNTTTGECK